MHLKLGFCFFIVHTDLSINGKTVHAKRQMRKWLCARLLVHGNEIVDFGRKVRISSIGHKKRQNTPFQNVLCSSKCRIKQCKGSLLSKFSLQLKYRTNAIATECTIWIDCFQNVLCKSKYRIKYQQNALSRLIAFKIVSVSKFNKHHPYFHISRGMLAYLIPTLIKSKHVLFFSLQFQIPFQIVS